MKLTFRDLSLPLKVSCLGGIIAFTAYALNIIFFLIGFILEITGN